MTTTANPEYVEGRSAPEEDDPASEKTLPKNDNLRSAEHDDDRPQELQRRPQAVQVLKDKEVDVDELTKESRLSKLNDGKEASKEQSAKGLHGVSSDKLELLEELLRQDDNLSRSQKEALKAGKGLPVTNPLESNSDEIRNLSSIQALPTEGTSRRESLPGAWATAGMIRSLSNGDLSMSMFTYHNTRHDNSSDDENNFQEPIQAPELTAENSGLVEALPIRSDHRRWDLESAEPIYEEKNHNVVGQEAGTEEWRQKWKHESTPIVCSMALCFLLLLGSGLGIFLAERSSPDGDNPTTIPTNNANETIGLVLNIPMTLPSATLEVLRNDIDFETPQAKAYLWMQGDPMVASNMYPNDRLIQRFAAATLYYATNGDTWRNNGQEEVSVITYGLGPGATGPGGGANRGESAGGGGGGGRGNGTSTAGGGGGGVGGGRPNGNGPNGGGGRPGAGSQNTTGSSNRPDNNSSNNTTALDNSNNRTDGDGRMLQLQNLGGNRTELDRGSSINFTWAKPWLSYDTHECTWFNTPLAHEPNKSILCRDGRFVNLNFYNNNLTGTLPPQIGLFTTLLELQLQRNKLTGPLPSQIGLLTNLRLLALRGNKLEGTLPTHLGLLSDSLLKFTPLNNRFRGTLPTELWEISALEDLRIMRNTFSGTIPKDLCNKLPRLRIFATAENEFTGTIPSTIGLCANLTLFDMKTNILSGALPSELGELTQLTRLEFAGNSRLTGTVPTELEQLTDLSKLSLERTGVTGTIPEGLCDREGFTQSFSCSEALCGCDCSCNAN